MIVSGPFSPNFSHLSHYHIILDRAYCTILKFLILSFILGYVETLWSIIWNIYLLKYSNVLMVYFPSQKTYSGYMYYYKLCFNCIVSLKIEISFSIVLLGYGLLPHFKGLNSVNLDLYLRLIIENLQPPNMFYNCFFAKVHFKILNIFEATCFSYYKYFVYPRIFQCPICWRLWWMRVVSFLNEELRLNFFSMQVNSVLF